MAVQRKPQQASWLRMSAYLASTCAEPMCAIKWLPFLFGAACVPVHFNSDKGARLAGILELWQECKRHSPAARGVAAAKRCGGGTSVQQQGRSMNGKPKFSTYT